MERPAVSSRGVYYDLSLSPYEYRTSYGDIFKFSSAKKLEIYTRDVSKELDRLEKLLDRNNLRGEMTSEFVQFLRRCVHRSFYKKIEG